ncbi:hypothetical protein A11A3_02002 [Alcanivorax hongdengensis A-11-3]|uniref:PelD GGDEF domain-containing protein n=1 Tax=Alcanivorax hongdengensis A-11-3 TaxID=1177179 RepID=L0WID2_9GAMM|nr:PelD GGDEF domain-containing protein [Alcanivorax hongdengensis]EKF75605.1 hypothetical protein A11A3_02002 [Alcanivorax hongdengensis A-11-3]
MLHRLISQRFFGAVAPELRFGVAIFETLVLVTLTLLLGIGFRPDDPLLLDADFLWGLLVPVLLALRYGSLAGVFAILCMVGSWFVLKLSGYYVGRPFPETIMLGGFILSLVCGEFADLWRVRLKRAESAASYALDRMQSLTQRHVLLRLSHDRLEENLLVKPYTVRDALERLRKLSLQEARMQALPAADDLLNLLAEYCQLQRCALYALEGDKLADTPVATLGENRPLQRDNSLLAFAMENQRLAHVQLREQEDSYNGNYLVCAPVTNSSDDMIGMLVIERLPFLSINQENLQLLAVLLSFYADVVHYGVEVEQLKRRWPDMPFRFGSELSALIGLHQSANVETTLTLFVADDSEQASQILDALGRGLRSLDLGWWLNDRTLMIMMPMTGESSLEGFVLRIEKWLEDDYAYMSLRQAGVNFFYRYLDNRVPEEQVAEILGAVDV